MKQYTDTERLMLLIKGYQAGDNEVLDALYTPDGRSHAPFGMAQHHLDAILAARDAKTVAASDCEVK